MNTSSTTTTALCGVLMLAASTSARCDCATTIEKQAAVIESAAETRAIDLAICLDTSGSMSGLIDAARQKIWEIVNDLALAEPTPDLRVALLTYGNDGHNAEDGWVYVQTDFTTDLDLVSERLFSLKTNGGAEYVGRVLHKATNQLAWHPSDDAMKLIIVAGNESADQDTEYNYKDAARGAITNGVMVNSIYCGNPHDSIAPGWQEVADLADGQYAAIDHNNGTIMISTPFDSELASLSSAINTTYIAYTPEGFRASANQSAQDDNSSAMNAAAAAARAQTKGGKLYRNYWDLVDASQQQDFNFDDIEDENLPENMRSMSVEERRVHVSIMATRRVEIQTKIKELGQKRQAHIDQKMKEQEVDGSRSFGHVIRRAVREQASANGFSFAVSWATADPEESTEGQSQSAE